MKIRICAAALLASVLSLGLARPAQAIIVERVVAVVGEQPILLSELRDRARLLLVRVHKMVPPGPQQAALESEALRRTLQQMVDERLMKMVADKHQITVKNDDVDGALERISGAQNMTVDDLLGEVAKSGLSVREYREELRRQILEGKLISLRIHPRVTEEDMRAAYDRMMRSERDKLPYHLQVIQLGVPAGMASEARKIKEELAARLVADARSGADFGQLARQYSEDPGSRDKSGDLGMQRPGTLDEPIEKAAATLDVGQVSQPFVYGEMLVIVKVVARASYADVRERIAEVVGEEQRLSAKRKWLDMLRRSMHVEVRL